MDFLFIILAYVIGSIPPGYLVARLYGIDIREHGSGNIGATNVARMLGTKFFFIVFFLDFIKSYLFVSMMQFLGVNSVSVMLGGLALIFGNGCSVFLNFRGGKAVATSCGVVAAWNPVLVVLVLIPWVITAFVTKRVGIASGAGYIALPIFASCMANAQILVPCTILISLWGLFLHRSNIREFLAALVSL